MAININIGKPIIPAKSLADELKDEMPSLETALSKPAIPAIPAIPVVNANVNIPIVTAEKYALLAEQSDTLSQETIDEFNLRMNYIISAMDNPELPDAMKRVLEYCQAHNELQPWLREQDIAIFVRGARQSYARVAAKKGATRSKRSSNAEMDKLAIESLMDLEINI